MTEPIVPKWWSEMATKTMNARQEPSLYDCPKCDSKSFQDTKSPLVLFQMKDDAINFESGIFVYATACRECGFMEFRSLDAMDIDPRKG